MKHAPSSSVHLPVTVYAFDRHSKLYRLVECLQCAVPCALPPKVLNCSAGLGMLGENLELLKAAMQTPAVILQNGARTKTLSASGDEVAVLPPTQRCVSGVWHCRFLVVPLTPLSLALSRIKIIKAYEMMCLNLSTHITHYRLRSDGALVLVDKGEINCVMCHVPESLSQNLVRQHLHSRANSIRKILRDRRIVVEIGRRFCVYSSETLQMRNVLLEHV